MELTACPQPECGLPCEIEERHILESSDGPVEHIRLLCIAGHRYNMPTSMLEEKQ